MPDVVLATIAKLVLKRAAEMRQCCSREIMNAETMNEVPKAI